MANFYRVQYPEDYYSKEYGSVISPQSWWDKHSYFIERGKPGPKDILIPPFILKDGKFADYMYNDCSFNLCSKRLMRIIEKHKSSNDIIEWYKVEIEAEGETTKLYIFGKYIA